MTVISLSGKAKILKQKKYLLKDIKLMTGISLNNKKIKSKMKDIG